MLVGEESGEALDFWEIGGNKGSVVVDNITAIDRLPGETLQVVRGEVHRPFLVERLWW